MWDSYLSDVGTVLKKAGGFVALPLIAGFAGLQPPWPPAIEFVSAAFILIAALVMWEWTRSARRAVRRRFIIAGILLTTVGIAGYLPLYSLYVENIPGKSVRVIRGTECTPKAKLVYPDDCPDLPRDALRGVEWESNVLWTRRSIMTVQLELVASWLAFTAGLVAFAGAVIAGRPAGKKPGGARAATAKGG